MSDLQYNIVFNGELSDHADPERVRLQFAKLFALSDSQVQHVFTSAPVKLKSRVDQRTAQKYHQAFNKIGLITSVVEIEDVISPPDVSSPASRYPLSFSGNQWFFFRYWLFNILLTLLTVGIYSAWAKVNLKRYKLAHLQLNQSSFEYLANPLEILKHRIMLAGLCILFIIASAIDSGAAIVIALCLFLSIPWFWLRSKTFEYHNTAYGNIRWNFHCTMLHAVKLCCGWPLAVLLSGGLLFPTACYYYQTGKIQCLRFGALRLALNSNVVEYNKRLLPFVLEALFIAGIVYLFVDIDILLAAVSAVVLSLVLIARCHAALCNLFYNALSAGDKIRFESTLKPTPYVLLFVFHALLIIMTVGLYSPFAIVRMLKYKAQSVCMVTKDDFDDFIGTEQTNYAVHLINERDIFNPR